VESARRTTAVRATLAAVSNLPRPPLDLRRPFTRAQARAAGISDGTLRGPRFQRLGHGLYLSRTVTVTPRLRLEAVLLVHPASAYASHASAARLYGLPLPVLPEEHVTVLHRRDRRRVTWVRHHVATPGMRTRVVHGVRVSSPVPLFLELAEQLDLVDLVVAGDALVRRHGVTPEQLVAAARDLPGRVGRLARRAAALVRRDVDSPTESKLRILLVLAGLPEPVVNHTIRWPDGQVRFRFDLSYPGVKVLVEYDGRQHRDDLDRWDADLSRRDWLDANGWIVVPVVARGLYRRPDETLARVRDALARAGVRTPRITSDEWRRYFPVVGARAA
jgi:very-short-patch-repair endonuclease